MKKIEINYGNTQITTDIDKQEGVELASKAFRLFLEDEHIETGLFTCSTDTVTAQRGVVSGDDYKRVLNYMTEHEIAAREDRMTEFLERESENPEEFFTPVK